MKTALTALALVAALAVPGTAYAADPPVNGPFSPTLTNSPVTVVICAVPGACVIRGR